MLEDSQIAGRLPIPEFGRVAYDRFVYSETKCVLRSALFSPPFFSPPLFPPPTFFAPVAQHQNQRETHKKITKPPTKRQTREGETLKRNHRENQQRTRESRTQRNHQRQTRGKIETEPRRNQRKRLKRTNPHGISQPGTPSITPQEDSPAE